MTELKYAFRSLFKSPGFTAVAILTIALGIGANTALFSVFNTVVLNPINLPDAGRLVRIWTNNTTRNIVAPIMSVPKYQIFSAEQTVFSDISAASFNSRVLTREGADPEQLTTLDVTASYVPTLRLALARGRNFTADEDKENGPHVAILSYDIWKTRFGKREDLIGSTIQLDGVGTTVVGILAEGLPAPLSIVQALSPWPFSPAFLTPAQRDAGAGFMQITARIKPGVTFAQAEAEVHAISKRYEQAYPGRVDGSNENILKTWIEEQVGPVRPTFILLLTAVGFVLLIACANVSNLFLSRLSARHKEIGIRLSLGATRRHLIRQFLLETLIFCTLAATLGLILALFALKGVQAVFVNQLQSTTPFSLDALTLASTIALSVLSSLAIGFVPAMQASNVNLADVLKDSSRGTVGGARGTRFRGFLIVAEVSLSVVLLIGSSLLLVSFVKAAVHGTRVFRARRCDRVRKRPHAALSGQDGDREFLHAGTRSAPPESDGEVRRDRSTANQRRRGPRGVCRVRRGDSAGRAAAGRVHQYGERGLFHGAQDSDSRGARVSVHRYRRRSAGRDHQRIVRKEVVPA